MLEPYALRTEYLENPMGMDEKHPRFSYKLRGNSICQKAYRITVRSEFGECVWDSGEVCTNSTLQIEYRGREFQPFTRYFWNVAATDETGETCSAGEDAWFETGFMDREWQAQWISTFSTGSETLRPPRRIFRTFSADGNVSKARLCLTALGVYSAAINGKEVAEDLFLPGWTDYRDRVQYSVHDVTALIRPGENTFSAVLADGWFNGRIARGRNEGKDAYGPFNLLKAELHFTDEKGSHVIASDDSFRAMNNTSAIRFSDIYAGETYDAAYDDTQWRLPGTFNSEHSTPCVIKEAVPAPQIVWHSGTAIRERMILTPVSVKRRRGGTWLVDFGQLFAGRERISLKDTDRGGVVTIRHGEILNPDGSLHTENLRSAAATTVYICAGLDRESYEPHFTYYGFRYLEISGWPGDLEPDMISGVVLSSIGEQTGSFRSSHKLLNQWHSNLLWTQRNNCFEVPTDCPQRDERLGWTGDGQIFMNLATYNFQSAAFYAKWIRDINASARRNKFGCFPIVSPYYEDDLPYSSGWSDAGIICPMNMYLKYGDTRLLEEGYPLMLHWLKTQEQTGIDGIVNTSRFGDWLYTDKDTAHDFIATACLHGMYLMVAEISDILGKTADAASLRIRANRTKTAFRRHFFDKDGNLKEQTQTAAVLALHYRLTDEETTQKTLNFLERDIRETHKLHLTTGLVGTQFLLKTLAEFGKRELAYELLLQTSAPSWLNQVALGGTTVWEHWDSFSPEHGIFAPEMNSFCHVCLGSSGDWLYEGIGGIQPSPEGRFDSGFRHFLLKPCFTEQLGFAEVAFESDCGRIASSWKALRPGFEWKVSIPPNTSATAEFPVPAEQVQCLGVSSNYSCTDGNVLHLGPGEFFFRFEC